MGHRVALAVGVAASLGFAAITACGTVDVGDNIVPPDLDIDEDFYYCVVQPQVVSAHRCASGGVGEMGMCHTQRSAMRLSADAETATPPNCASDRVVDPGSVPDSYRENLDVVRVFVQSDALSSPFYLRPVGLQSHPRTIFATTDPAAETIVRWLSPTP
jgi:hypothetical protein